jgi:hypothetical protein
VLNDGNIKVSNLTASDNTFDGAWLDNASYWTTGFANGTVTLTGFGNFDHNFHPSGAVFGLRVNSRGSVTLNRVSADENSAGSSPGAGVNVTSVTGNITLVCSSAYGNTGTGTTGLTASTPLTLTLIGWYSYYNSSPDNLSFLMKVTKPCP